MLKIIGFWYVLSGESWPLRPHTPISSPHSDPIFFSKVIKGHHLTMPKPGQEDPFLFGSFFPISDPHPNIHPSVTLHCPTVFPQDFFSPCLHTASHSLSYSYSLITLLEPRACCLPAHVQAETNHSFWNTGQIMLWDLQFKSPQWVPMSILNNFTPQMPTRPLCSVCLHLQLCPPGNRCLWEEMSCSVFYRLYCAQPLAWETCSVNVEQNRDLLTGWLSNC